MNTILRLPQVKRRTGLSKSSIYAFMANSDFPKSISLGERAIGWIEKDITDWIEQQITTSCSNVERSNPNG